MKPELMRIHAEYERDHWWFVARRRIVTALIHDLLPPSKDRLIIDVGCGTGITVARLASEYSCIGIDSSEHGVALARESYPHCDFRVGDAPQDLGADAGRADLFLLMDVLEHVRDDVALFTSVMAAAKPGALALITVPANPALWSAHVIVHMHYRRYTHRRLAGLWTHPALTPLLVAHCNRRLYPLVRLVRAVSNARGRAAGSGGTDLRLPPAPVNRVLAGLFGGEAHRLRRRLRRGAVDPNGMGVSLLAIVRREAGPLSPQTLPAELADADVHDPEPVA